MRLCWASPGFDVRSGVGGGWQEGGGGRQDLGSNDALGSQLLLIRIQRLKPQLREQVPELAERLQPVLRDRLVVVGVRPRLFVEPTARDRTGRTLDF